MKHKHGAIEYVVPYVDWQLYYTYELVDPRSKLPFYVGKGRGDRVIQHISHRNAKTVFKSNPHKSNTINQIVKAGLKVLCRIVFVGTEQDCFDQEILLISKYGYRHADGLLCNITRGGEGNTSHGRMISQFNMFGEFLRHYKNAREAALANGWNHYSLICSCCRGRDRSYMGYLWAYKGELPNLLEHKRVVYQWSTRGILINKFESVADAGKLLQCDPSSITGAITGKSRLSSGFVWSTSNVFPGIRASRKTKQVLNLTTGVTYQSVSEASVALCTSATAISAVCAGRVKSYKGNIFIYK